MQPDYVIKVKIGDTMKVVGSGFRQDNGVVRIQLDVIPYDKLIWLFPFERR